MENRILKFRVWDNVGYMSRPFTLNDLQNNTVRFTKECKVMQFAGIIINGKEVYEYDIIMTSIPSDFDIVKKYIVGFYNGCFCLFKNKNDKYPIRQWNDGNNDWFSVENIDLFCSEVIGNIYENPNLL